MISDGQIQSLLDKQELTELVTRVSRAVDRCDEELLLSCYHPDAFDDHGTFKGNPKEFLAYLKRGTMIPTNGPVQHSLSNLLFEIDGDVAWGEIYVQSRMVNKGGKVDQGMARYIDRYERRDGDWRIAHRRVILEAARPGFDTSAFVAGSRDRNDPSYSRERTAAPTAGEPAAAR
jgi:ketosteroid isomerase-like protein